MTLNHFRTITKTRNNVKALRKKINQIKGNPIGTYYDRERGGRGRRYNKYQKDDNKYDQRQRYYGDEQKDGSPNQYKYERRGRGRGRGSRRGRGGGRGGRR